MLSYSLNNKQVAELRDLSDKAAQLALQIESIEQAELDYIHRSVLVSSIGASTRIENAVLTDAEISWVDTTLTKDSKTTAFLDKREFIQNKLSKDKERSIDEVVGCRALLQLIYSEGLEMQPLSQSMLRGLHEELLRYYAPASHYRGRYKTATNSVVRKNMRTGEETPVLITSSPGPITDTAMSDLIAWYNQTLAEHPWTIAVAIEFVFRFLAIHPFQDGNGRLGRALFLLILFQSPQKSLSSVVPYLAIDRQIEKAREEYYLVLRRCSEGKYSADPKSYKYEYLLKFMMKAINAAFDSFAFYQMKYRNLQKLSPSALQVLECFQEMPEVRLQIKQIIEKTRLPRTTINDALKSLLEKKFIQNYGQKSATRYQLIF